MKNIEEGSIAHLVAQIVAIAVFGVILYPLFDFLLCKFFTHSEFVYSVQDHIVEPILFGTIMGTILWGIGKKGKK